MKKYTVKIPPTVEQGNYSTQADNVEEALWDYNDARGHDGLLPIKKLPKGTKFIINDKN